MIDRTTSVVIAMAVGLLVVSATTWLVPVGGESQAVHDFAGPYTGVGLLDGPWQTTESAKLWIGRLGMVVYLAAAVTVLAGAGRSWLTSTVASIAALVATIGVLVVKPGEVELTDWDYAWQSPPFLACGSWLVILVVSASKARAPQP